MAIEGSLHINITYDGLLLIMVFQEGGIFIVSHLLWHGATLFVASPNNRLNFVALYDNGALRIYYEIIELFNEMELRLLYYTNPKDFRCSYWYESTKIKPN